MKTYLKRSKYFAALLLAIITVLSSLTVMFPARALADCAGAKNSQGDNHCDAIYNGCPGATSAVVGTDPHPAHPSNIDTDLYCAYEPTDGSGWQCPVATSHFCIFGAPSSNATKVPGTGSGSSGSSSTHCPGAASVPKSYNCANLNNAPACPGYSVTSPDPVHVDRNTTDFCPFKPDSAAWTCPANYCTFKNGSGKLTMYYNGSLMTPCPGAAGIKFNSYYDCTTIPNGCPGYLDYAAPGVVTTTNTLTCPFKPSDTNWVCPWDTCKFSDGTTVSKGQTAVDSSTDGGPVKDPELDCGTTGSKLDIVICPVVKLVELGVEALDNAIISLLSVDPKNVDENPKDNNPGILYYQAWKSFRDIALGIVVIAALIMLIGQALGFEVLDAYTLKKVMPRLVVAIIGIALSWQIMKWFVIFTNDLGFGVRTLIYAPFKSLGGKVNIGGGSSFIITLLTAGAILALKIGGLLTLGGTAGLALLIAFTVMVLRQIVIVLLIMIAPLAIAAYILPNTQGLWKLWHESFTKGLLMFPIIMAFLSTGRVFAEVAAGPGHTPVGDFVAFFAYILPYFLIPLTFRFAGGALRTIGGFANDKSRGAFDRLKKRRQAIMSKNWNDAKNQKYFRGTGALASRLNRGIQTGTLLSSAGFNPRRMRSNIRAARSTRGSALAAEAEKSAAARTVLGNDDLLTAALHGNGTDADARQYLYNLGQRGSELEQNVQSIRQAKLDMGVDAFEEHAAANLAGTGTGYRNGPADMLRTINRVAGNDRAKAGRMLVAARSAAQRAQRTDLYGAGMSVAGDLMAQQYAGQVTDDEINEHMTDEALRTKSITEIAQSRGGSVRNMQGAMTRRLAYARDRLDAAIASGDPAARGEAEHNYKRVLAATAQMQEEAGRASPENAQMLGAVLGQTTGRMFDAPMTTTDRSGNPVYVIDPATGNPVTTRRQETYLDQIDSLRSDREFTQYRREYATAAGAAAAAGGAAAGAAAAAGGGPEG